MGWFTRVGRARLNTRAAANCRYNPAAQPRGFSAPCGSGGGGKSANRRTPPPRARLRPDCDPQPLPQPAMATGHKTSRGYTAPVLRARTRSTPESRESPSEQTTRETNKRNKQEDTTTQREYEQIKKILSAPLNTSTPRRMQPTKLLQLLRPHHPLERNPAWGGSLPGPLHQKLQITPRSHLTAHLASKVRGNWVLLPLDAHI